MPQFLTKSGYYIVPSPSTILIKTMVCLVIVTECSDNCFVSFYEYDKIVV